MAEKYGTVPPRFTKDWWEYFWDYYKWRVIITVVVLIIVAVTIVQCATQPKYDMNMIYSGHMNYSEGEINKVQDILAEYITDVDGDDKQSILFQQLVFADNAGAEQYDYAMQTKLDMSFMDNCTFVYLFDKTEADKQVQKEKISDLFEVADDWAGDKDAIKGTDGRAYAISLNDSEILKSNDIYCEDLYVMIRKNYKTDEENIQAHQDSINLAKVLVK